MSLDRELLAEIQTAAQAQTALDMLQVLADAVFRSPGGRALAVAVAARLSDEELAILALHRDNLPLNATHIVDAAGVVPRLLQTQEGRAALTTLRNRVAADPDRFRRGARGGPGGLVQPLDTP